MTTNQHMLDDSYGNASARVVYFRLNAKNKICMDYVQINRRNLMTISISSSSFLNLDLEVEFTSATPLSV